MEHVMQKDLTRKILRKSRIPINGGIELLSCCNLKCIHCYNAEEKREFMDKHFAFCIADQLEKLGTLHVYLTGGEVMLHPSFIEIYEYFRKKGILVSLMTNGTLLTDEILECLLRYTPYLLDISLYGATEETYEKVTGVKGAFDKLLNNLKKLQHADINFSLKTVALKENFKDAEGMLKIANSFGKRLNIYSDIRPCNNGNTNPLLHVLNNQEIIQLEEKTGKWDNYKPVKREHDVTSDVYYCEIGQYTFFIDYKGIMYGCVKDRLHGSDLHNNSIKNAFDNNYAFLKSRNGFMNNKCIKCVYRLFCNYCPAQFELETGDPTTPPLHVCSLTKDRYNAFYDKVIHK